jgi:5'(3')-deoxyribonucleotidase
VGKPILLTDVDGVLLNWIDGFEQFLTTHHGYLQHQRVQDFVSLQQRLGVDQATVDSLVEQFHFDISFETLESLPGAATTVKVLAKWFDLVAITACGTDPRIQEARARNLEHEFGSVFKRVLCTDTFEGKAEYLTQFEPTWWIEDHINNAELGTKFGHKGLLIDAPYNQGDLPPGVSRVQNMPHAGMIILSQSHSIGLL